MTPPRPRLPVNLIREAAALAVIVTFCAAVFRLAAIFGA